MTIPDKLIKSVIEYYSVPNWKQKHEEFINNFKKKGFRGNISESFGIAILGLLAIFYGLIDILTDARLPFGIVGGLIGGTVVILYSIYKFFKNIGKLRENIPIKYYDDLTQTCLDFYMSIYGKSLNDPEQDINAGSKMHDNILDICHILPVPIIENINNIGYLELTKKWYFEKLKYAKKKDVNFSDFNFKDIKVSKKDKLNSKLYNIEVEIYCENFKSDKFNNIAFENEGNWFLLNVLPKDTNEIKESH
jgi:hypothetical protein